MTRFEAGEIQSFGEWIESRRRGMNLTRVELAEKVGCAAVTIKKLERDERKPSRQLAELLAEHLAIPRADRDTFMRMARGGYMGGTASPQTALRLPTALQQEGSVLHPPEVDFVERRKELARLVTFLNESLAGKPAPVFLLGEAGSGKTSLMREFARLAQQATPRLLVAGGQCNAQTGQGDAFRPFRDILGILTGDLEFDWTEGMLNRWQALEIWASIPDVLEALAGTGPHLLDTLLPTAPLIHRIAPYVSGKSEWFDRFQTAAEKAPSQHAGLEQGQVLEELTRVLRTIAAQRPLLLLLDDLQWADDASLNLLFHLARRLAGSRILIVGAFRTGESRLGRSSSDAEPDGIHTTESLILELTRYYGDIQIRLDQASESDGRAFIDALLDQQPNRLGESFRDDFYLHTRGHALFTVELLQSMRQNQDIVLDGAGYWVENRSSPPHQLPARIEAVIAQRLARLNPLERQLLDVASVQGEVFIAEVVAKLLAVELGEGLNMLSHALSNRHRLVQEQGQFWARSLSLSRFQFQHMLVQEYLYGALDPSEKRRLHRRSAEVLEGILSEPQVQRAAAEQAAHKLEVTLSPEYLDAFGPALLHHFELGEAWARVAIYAFALAGRAKQRYAMRESMAYYERALLALDQLPDAPDEFIVDVLLAWVDAAFKFTAYEEQLTRLSRAEAIARRLNDKPRLAQTLHWTANVLVARGLWTRAGSALTESLALAEEVGDESLSVRPAFFRALMTTFADPAGSLKWIAQAEDLSHKHHDPNTEAWALGAEAHVRAQLGESARSQEAIAAARRISDGVGSPLLESDVDLFAAWASLAMGEPVQALEFGHRSVERAIATDNMDCICSGFACIGYSNLELGRGPEAASAFEKGIERSEAAGAISYKLIGQAGLAMTRFMRGDSQALEDLERVAVELSQFENHVGAANANHLLGLCLMQRGDLERASSCLTQAAEFYRRSKMHPSLVRVLTSLAELRDRLGQVAEARILREEAESFRPLSGESQ